MKGLSSILFLGAAVLCGCKTAHDVAVSSFRVIDAPANYVRRHIDDSDTTTTTTTTTTIGSSDAVTAPGRPVQVAPSSRQPQQRPVTASSKPVAPETSRPEREPAPGKPKSTSGSTPHNAANSPTQIPTAKPVPGKAGYVFSPYDPNGGYVDVNGFSSGSKVKDPYSGKIFLVP